MARLGTKMKRKKSRLYLRPRMTDKRARDLLALVHIYESYLFNGDLPTEQRNQCTRACKFVRDNLAWTDARRWRREIKSKQGG